MRALIVGCGYVGRSLGVELVRQGHVVYGLRRNVGSEAELRLAGIQPLFADITRPETLAGLPREFDWVVNCTASGGGGVDDYRRIYLAGNRNLIAWLADRPPRKFVYTSSTSVYGQNDGSMVDETSPVEPAAATAQVLVETEQLLLSAAREARFPSVILRVAGIYGPGRGHALRQFLNGAASLEGDGSRWLNMIQREDLVQILIAALTHGPPGEIFNAADNHPVRQREFHQWLADELGRPLPGTAVAETPRRRGMTNKRVSNAKLRAQLAYDFRYPDFRAGYAAAIAQLKATGALEF